MACRCSSIVEQFSCKELVAGATPAIGSTLILNKLQLFTYMQKHLTINTSNFQDALDLLNGMNKPGVLDKLAKRASVNLGKPVTPQQIQDSIRQLQRQSARSGVSCADLLLDGVEHYRNNRPEK